jgi:hypothetical protein
VGSGEGEEEVEEGERKLEYEEAVVYDSVLVFRTAPVHLLLSVEVLVVHSLQLPVIDALAWLRRWVIKWWVVELRD